MSFVPSIDPAASDRRRRLALAFAVVATAALAGCGSLFAPPPPAPHHWTLDPALPERAAPTPAAAASAPVVVVSVPRAAAGFDSERIAYTRDAHRLEPYADNLWVDTPPRMLGPLIAEALARTGAFGAVLASPAPANGQWQLDTQIVRLQHEVEAQRVRFTLRATLVDKPGRTVVAAREFDAVAPTPSTDAAGAVAAANAAVADVLRQLAAFSVEALAARPPVGAAPAPRPPASVR